MTRPQYFVPVCVAVAVFGALYALRDVRSKTEREVREERPTDAKLIEFPHGRVLYVVVDEKSVYVGDDPIAFEMFDRFLREDGRRLKPDYAFVLGTDLARYGKVVEVYAAIRNILAVPGTMVTHPVAIGTRHRAIEVHEHFWEYGSEEDEEPNQSPEPTPTAGTSAAEQPLVPSTVVAHL